MRMTCCKKRIRQLNRGYYIIVVMKVSLVLPVYNEHLILREVLEKYKTDLSNVCRSLNASWEIIAVNDGCTDGSKEILVSAGRLMRNLRIVNLEARYGKQAAITAGMEAASGDVVILADVDLLNPVGVIGRVVEEYLAGHEIVYAYREHLVKENLRMRVSEKLVELACKVFGVEGEYMGKANLMLFSRAAADVIVALPNKNKLLRTMDTWVGFRIHMMGYASGYNRDEIAGKVRNAKKLDKMQGHPKVGRATAREHTPSKVYSLCSALLSVILLVTLVVVNVTVGMNIFATVGLGVVLLGLVTIALLFWARAIMIKRVGVVHFDTSEPIYRVESVIN